MVVPGDKNWNEEQTWESLLGEPVYGGLDFPTPQNYSEGFPTQHQETLSHIIGHDKTEHNQEASRSGSQLPLLSKEGTPLGNIPTETSTTSNTGLNWREIPAGDWNQRSISQQNSREPSSFQQQAQQPQYSDFFTRTDDASLSFDELGSSLGSSLYTEVLTPSYSSSVPYPTQPISGPSAYLSPPTGVRSPSSSLRTGSYLTGSLRNTSSNTPRTRHASISNSVNSGSEGILPGSISHEDRLKRKREFHNAVERRRRELIKQKIKELGTIVPPSLLNYDISGKQVKPNKSIILNKTVEYLEYLLQVLEAQDRKKVQLLRKLRELYDKGKDVRAQQQQQQQQQQQKQKPIQHSVPPSMGQTPPLNEFDDLPGKIIDTRAMPSQSPITTNEWDNQEYNLQPTNDDLEQFLSGDLIEAEDNAKLMFGEGDANPADYLLEYDS